MKEEVNPHLLWIQFILDQSMRRENLRISGLPESQEENEEVLVKEVMPDRFELSAKKVAMCRPHGAPPKTPQTQSKDGQQNKPGKTKPSRPFVRFLSRRKWDQHFDSRFKHKGEDAYKGGFINDDLTTMWYKVLMAAKKAPDVKGVTSKHGNVICKMNDAPLKLFVLQMASLM